MTREIDRQPSVLLVSHGFQQAYERGFSNGLAYAGIKVTLVSSDQTDSARIDKRIESLNLRGSQDERRSGLKKALNLARYHLRLLGLVYLRRNSVIHVIGLFKYPVLMGLLEAFLFSLFSRRYVLTVHNLLPHDRRSLQNRLVYRWIYQIPDMLIVHTETMKQGLVESFFVPGKKIIVMEHGCEMELSDMRDTDALVACRQANSPDNSFSLLFFGAVAPYKGLDLLLQAFEGLGQEFRLNIVGYCKDAEYKAHIWNLISDSPGQDHIEWLDKFVTEEEMFEAFSLASAVILPYRHIDQSGVLFQAFRFGLPVVAARVGEFDRYVSKDFGEIFEPANVSELRLAIQRLYQRRREFRRGKIMARAHQLDWRKTVSVLHPVYS